MPPAVDPRHGDAALVTSLSDVPSDDGSKYTSEALTGLTAGLLDQLDVTVYALYVQDYRAPISWRPTLANPAAMSAITCQNGNGHEVGFAEEFCKPVRAHWAQQSSETEKALMLEATRSPRPTCSAAVISRSKTGRQGYPDNTDHLLQEQWAGS
ncbi:hypothetical protein [Streptomyces chartreusis]|uniref:hypothetical protein n=1 Tax=Streptomyces chartreusis TaxID=1969 RepID=UPI00382C1037